MRLSAVTDEISSDLEQALDVCDEFNIKIVELRKVYGKNIVEHDDDSVKRIKNILDQRGFQVCSIASPFLKCPFWSDAPPDSSPELEEEREWAILERSFELARLFNAPFVRTFSFMRAPDPLQVRHTVLEIIREAVRRTEAAGLKLIIENEHACNIATGEETGWLLEQIPSPTFGVIWDPGNEARVGSDPFPSGYRHVRGRVYHVHLKDADANRRHVKMGTGTIDYVGQFRALAEDGYDGLLSLETHYAHPTGGMKEASRECLVAIIDLLQQAGVKLQQ